MQMIIEKETLTLEEAKKTLGLRLEPENTEEPRFEIRERTKGLADPLTLPLTKNNLEEIMLGLLDIKEIKELEKKKKERDSKQKR